MRDVGSFQLLSQEEEIRWSRQFHQSRQRVQELLDQYPQVIVAKLLQLRDNSAGERLDKYMTAENDVEFTAFLQDSSRIRQILDFCVKRYRHREQSVNAPTEKAAPADDHQYVSGIIAPYLQELGRMRFLQRFYSSCVDLFISGAWQAPEISPEEHAAICKEMNEHQHASEFAMKKLVEGNLRLVISIARRYASPNVPLSDLVQEGNIGLMRAVESFEYQLGHRFSTYASYWIRQAISRAMNSYGRSIRIPMNILRQLSRIRRAEQQLLQKNGVIPTVHEIAAEVDLPPHRVNALQKMSMQPISLQSIATDDQNWNDFLADENSPQPGSTNTPEHLQHTLQLALDTLDPRSREILSRHFGLMGRKAETLDQIAKSFNLTSERIRQIETIALRQLRRPEANRYLDELRN